MSLFEDYPTREAASDVVEGLISEYVKTGLAIADTGTPDKLDRATWEACIHEIRNLHLAEPHLPASKILDALLLLGWTAPA